MLHDRPKVARHLACAEVGRRVEQNEIDVIAGRETNHITRRLERGERRRPGGNLERRCASVDGRGRRCDLVLRGQQTHDDERAVLAFRQRLRNREQGVEPVVLRGDHEQRALRLGRQLRLAWQVERRILRENPAFELVQRLRRLDAELLDERHACPAVDLERLGLASRAVEREHQLAADPLSERVVPHERLELGEERPVAPERELGIEALLERREAQLVESCDRRLRELFIGEVCQRCSTPELERATEELGRGLRVRPHEGQAPFARPALETVEVEPAGFHVDEIAG